MGTPANLTGTLNMLMATIDWRDETARCVGVFRSHEHAAVEVEYKVILDESLLNLLARAFLKAGIPVLRGSKANLPAVQLLGDTLHEYLAAKKAPPKSGGLGIGADGVIATPEERAQTLKEEVEARRVKYDRRTKEGKAAYEAAERERLQRSLAGVTGGNGHGGVVTGA